MCAQNADVWLKFVLPLLVYKSFPRGLFFLRSTESESVLFIVCSGVVAKSGDKGAISRLNFNLSENLLKNFL